MGKPSDLFKQEEGFNESADETLDFDWGNHDENAKVQRIARDEDLPEEAVRENLDELTRTRKKYDFSDHPKSAEFFADPDNASVVGDDVEHYKSLEQTLKDRKEPIFGERTAKLAWNAMTEARASITRALGTIAEGQREKIIRRYLGDDTYERAKAIDEKVKKEGAYVDPIEELSKTENRYAFKEGIDFSRKRTPETVKKAFYEEGLLSAVGEAGGFMYDTGVESMATQIPLMAIKTAGAPFYLLNLTEQIAQERAKNNGKEMTDEDMAWALPWAVGSYALDLIGFKGMVGAGKSEELLKEVAEGIAAKTVVKEGLKAGGREAGTEAFQDGFLEYMGERFGTEAKIELSEMLETGAWAGLAGGGMGVAIGTPSAYLNDRERRIKVLRDNERRRDINSVDGQLTIESVLDVVQQMPSVERSPEHVEKFMQAVGPDKQIIVTNDGLKAASTLGIQIPEGMRSPLGDAVLRISDFVNQVANKPDLLAAIRPHLKMRQEDMTQFEMDKQEGNPELAYLFGKADKASKLEKENRAAIEGVVKAMAGTRRMSEGTARKLTKFLSEYANRYVEDAAKKGVEITPKDAIDAMKLRFVGPKVDMDKEVNFEKAAARMLPREEFESFKKLPKSEQLDRVARHYAALPVEQGGLGLSATNTREERENALGVKFKSGEDYVPQVSKSKPLEQSALPDKITIDGVEKHTRNSNGDYIAADEQGIRNFYEWFGASKVVDAEGRPLVVYHGGKEGIEEFDAGKAGSIQSSDWGRGIYFTPTEWVANSYKEDANKATNEAANAAWDAIEAKSKEYGTDPMYVSIHLNSKKITQEQYDEIKALEKEWRDALGEAKKVGGDVYAVYLRMEDPLYYTYDGITDHTLSMQAKAQGKDGLIVEPMTEYVAFNPTQIKSVNNRGTFSGETGNIYRQSAPDRLTALHNLTQGNLSFADKMGGLAVPSISVIPEGLIHEGFGEITLIGSRDIADPEMEPVFDSDAYTVRFPRPTYKKAKVKDADKITSALYPFAVKFDDKASTQNAFEYTVNNPDPQRLIDYALRSVAWAAMFLDSKGEKVDPVMKDEELRNAWAGQKEWLDWYKHANHSEANNAGYDSKVMADYRRSAGGAAKSAIASYVKEKAKGHKDLKDIYLKEAIDEDGEMYIRVLDRAKEDVGRIGKTRVDTYKTREMIEKRIESDPETAAEFARYIENKILPIMGDPLLDTGRKKVPYTLDNIVDYMTSSKVKGVEKTMVFGHGNARAAAAVRFKSLETMREHAKEKILPEKDVAEARERAGKLLEEYRDEVINHYTIKDWRGNIDTWAGLDSSMRVIAKIATSKRPTAEMVKAALKKEGFEGVPNRVIEKALIAAEALITTPVPYFEAKPQRVVSLSEFKGAVIPETASKETKDILEKNGIKWVGYKDESERSAKVGELSRELNEIGGGTLFQRSESGFFSQLQKAAVELKQEKGTPEQMLAMLKKAGAKDAEIEAVGLKEFLELAGKSITKAQIVEFVSNNGVQVETTVLGAEVEEKEDGFTVSDDDGRRMASFETEEEADSYASENGGFVEPSARQQARESRARNTNYTLPGGENHVELVLSIPNIEGWNKGDTTHYGDIADGKAVAWVRANDRTDADGKKVLFIEEIQSKRAQEGRSKGFVEKYTREGIEPIREGIEVTDPERFWYFRVPGNVLQILKSKHQTEEDAINYIIKEKTIRGYVPPAPFVEKTDAWVSLAMKRMITYAVENGYDRVAWTTGEQQADRYKLSKQVTKIVVPTVLDDGSRSLRIESVDGPSFNMMVDRDGVVKGYYKAEQFSGKKVEEIVGKGMAEQIMKADSETTFEGDGLNIGGEGMKSFYDKIIPSVTKEVTKKMDGKVVSVPIVGAYSEDIRIGVFSDGSAVVEGAGDDKEFDTIEEAEEYRNELMDAKLQPGFDITDKMREQVQGPGLPLFQNIPDPLGATYQMPLGDRVIKLFEKSNPSTMLHEMSHLFLLMEQDFAEKYGMTETHKDLLKWLGVESFDQITKDHHEQFAGSFEAYIMEGKSPSIALSDVFAAAKHWMLQVYEFIRNIPNQKIDPEISSIFDRLLATEQQLEEVKGSPMYNQFFADKDEAGWSNKDWIDYIGLQARRENKAKETIDQKLMKEWKRMRTKEWLEERNAIQETEEAVLKASPVYRAMASMREFKLNRDQALEAMGLDIPLSAEDRARKAAIPKPTDSLLVFAAKRGGLNIEAYKNAGIDPADMKKTQSGVFGKPVFTKDGMTPAQFAEAATEAGYMESRGYTIDAETYDDLVDDNDVLDLVTRSVIQGEEFFTVEGDAIRQEEADKQRYLDQYFEEHGQYPPEEVVEETPEQKLAKSLKKYLSTDGMPVEMTATEHGYGSAKEMIEAVLAAPKIKDQAKINADEAMVAKYGTLLDDATLEAEVRDAVQNEEQAKLLLMEIKALGKVAKKKEINRDYLKMKATRLVDEMKRSDMRTGGVYRRMIKAAEAAKKANAEAAKIRAAIAKEKEAAAGELAAEVGERAVEAQNQLEEAEKDYKKKKEIMQDVYEDLKRAKEKAKETDKRKKELRDIKDLKKALGARKKSGEEINEEEYKAENKAITARINEAMERVNESAKADLSRQAAIVRLEKDYDVSRAEAQAARKLADTMKERAEKQVTRATEKEGKVEDAKSETAKKQAELEAELVAVAEKALEFKIQHLANHYLYQEITERRAAMDKQLTYLRRVDGKDYDPKVVDPDYIAQAKKLIRLYNTVTKSKKDERKLTEELSELLSWYDTQVKAAETLDQDEGGTGNRQPLLWLSEELIAALAAKREGNLAEFKLKQISNMTAAEVQGLYDTIKHIRYIGGKTSEDAKAEYQKSQEEIADNIKENAGKTIKRKHEKNVFDRTKEALGAYWHSMESSFLMFSILDGFSNGQIMQHWESFIDAVNRHIELERDFAKTIDGIMRPILVKIASPIKVTITKEDGVSWSLSKQARFVLLLNMGNQSNIDTVLQGMNANFDDSYTYNDLMQMVSGMSKAELEAANKIWAYKDQTLWPAISAIQRKVSGVSAAKIEPVPFVVNGVEMIGGHYRLHYKADQKDQGRDFELESVGKMKMLMGKQASQIERVGSGGREVDLEHIHLYTDISQELRFIAFKEFSISISKFLNGANNPVRAAIIQHHGAEFLKYLEDTINGVVNRPANAMDMFSRGSRAIRSNMVYSYLSFSLRSIVQAFSAVAPMMSQLGEARTLMAFMEFWSNPYGNFKKVDSMSMAMKERLKFVNHEATTELSKLSAWSPVVNLLKKGAFMPHAVIDAFFAYPAWMGAKRKYLDENPVDSNTDFKRREKLANDFADLTMKQIMGSGHKADVGGVFSSPDEMVKSILFMGTFSNSMFNTNAYNIEKFKAGKMPWYELARRQGWMMIGAPLIWLAVLDEFPDPEDENYWLKMAGQIVGYNFSMLVAANHVYNYAVNDFEFTLPLMKAVESAVGLSRSGKALVMGDEEFDLKMQAKIVRDLGPLIPMFGGSEMSRIMKGIEEERDWYSTYVTGKRD